jgi:hypothetical protein
MSNLKKFDVTSFYSFKHIRYLSLSELEKKPTLRRRGCDQLKLEGILVHFDEGLTLDLAQFRLWFSCPDSKDKEANNKVTLETLSIRLDEPYGVWKTLEEWQAIEWFF